MESLIATADDSSVDGPATAGYPLERLDIATRGHQILAARGIAAEAATYDQLAGAYEQAEAELASGKPKVARSGVEARRRALDVMAQTILVAKGKTIETVTQDEYLAAVDEAGVRLGVQP